jgi:hypothetical protein
MDKEPTLLQVWVLGAVAAILGFVAWRRHFMLGTAVSLVAAVLAWSLHQELADPHVGPAIVAEAGRSYVIQVYGVMLLCVALHVAGAAGATPARSRGCLKYRASEQ